ncbi:MAG: S-layer homology domain-containing protein [Oscillospiraceae bacterium]|nr:S-layer homology domain-containing protein [Oscillospiraceae bacterium]
MIRRIFIILAAVFLFVLAVGFMLESSVAVYADVVWSNDFYDENKSEIESLSRNRFCANGPEGYITFKEEPGTEIDISDSRATYDNGAVFTLDGIYIYESEYWGGNADNGHYSKIPGWVPMNHLLVVYIPTDFAGENEDDFYDYVGNFDTVYAARRLVFWQWPGSDREKRVLESESYKNAEISVRYAYKDDQGREWGYVRINNTGGWICFTEPDSINIPAFYPAPPPTKWSRDGIFEWTHPDAQHDAQYDAQNDAQNGAIQQQPQYLLSNINKDKEYEPDQTFVDIPANAWYKNAVTSAYEYGVIYGVGDNRFDPGGTITIQNTIDIAARIHACYKYGKEEGDKWLSIYDNTYNQYIGHGYTYYYASIRYCESEELIKYGEYSFEAFDYDIPFFDSITRAEMVHIWSKILQPKDMVKQNMVLSLPDVITTTPYYEDVKLFYEAGIIGGVDDQGTFKPDDNITRAEAATIFMNLIDVSKRHIGKTYGNASGVSDTGGLV